MPLASSTARALVITTLVAAGATGCSTNHDGDGPLGEATQAVDGICGNAAAASLDGFPAYPWCNNNMGHFNVYTDNGIDTQSTAASGWTETEGGFGYQCVEFAVRYFYFKWNVSHGWFFNYATDMCGTHPSDVSVTTTPVHGDLAVIKPNCGGSDPTAGHVFGIDSINGTQIHGIQQNPGGAYTWPDSCVQCYLHATNNGGHQDPCSTAPSGGYYCGQSTQWGGGTPNVLYLCQNGVTQSMTPCQYGCQVEPAGTNDQCNAGPPDPCASAPSGGYYCGQSTQFGGGTPNVLYLCQNGKTASMTPCPYGCLVEPPGTNDMCDKASMGSSSSSSSGSSTTSSSGSGTGGTTGTGGTSGTGGVSGTGGTSGGNGGSNGSGASTGQGAGTAGSTQKGSSCAASGAGNAGGSAAILVGLVVAGLGRRRRRS